MNTTEIVELASVTEQLEQMIDRHGLLHIVTGLELVCGEKADHLRVNWQDNVAARNWDNASGIFAKIAAKIETMQL